MGKVIFHPGIGKTGTTAIQSYAHRYFLNDENNPELLYSPVGLDGKDVHNSFADNHPSFTTHAFSQNLMKLIEFAKSTDKNVLVSSEFLIRASAPHIKYILETIRNNQVEVRVVVAIRNYTDYLISSYLQAVKVKWGMKPGEDLQDYCRREIQNIRMPLLVDQWSRVIGDDKVFIFDYDKQKSSLLSSFFSAIAGNPVAIQNVDQQVNASIKLSYARILLEYDRVSGDLAKRNELISLLNSCSFNAFDEDSQKEKVQAIVKNQYLHDYERLQARYTVL